MGSTWLLRYMSLSSLAKLWYIFRSNVTYKLHLFLSLDGTFESVKSSQHIKKI